MSQVFDVNSYLASLQGSLLTLQNNLQTQTQMRDTAQSNSVNTSQQLQNLTTQYYSTSLGEQGVSTDQLNQLHDLGNQVNAYDSTVSQSNSQISLLNTQISSLKDQITAAQNIVSQQRDSQSASNVVMNSTSNPTVTSLGISLPDFSHYLSSTETALGNVPPVYLAIGGGVLLLLLLK